MKLFVLILCLVVSFSAQLSIKNGLEGKYAELPEPQTASVLPHELIELASIEYRNLVADIFFLKVINRFGSTLEGSNSNIVGANIDEWEWLLMMEELELSASLDPYFLDPYYFANAIMTHYEPLIPEITRLLERGASLRDWDWELPFYTGFNYFYFLKDPLTASQWLMDSAKRPTNKSSLLPTLAARLAYEGQQTENAIVFLKQMLSMTTDVTATTVYKARLKSLERIYVLEKAVDLYTHEIGKAPENLGQLVSVGVLKEIPVDPYGGVYYLDNKKKVHTTSNLRPTKR